MIKYLSFLRAINVGGHNIVKMEMLRKIYEAAKLKNVTTYIQSGNVIFESPEKNTDLIVENIRSEMLKKAGFETEVFIRTSDDFYAIIAKNPFHDVEITKTTKLYLTFLPKAPPEENRRALEILSYDAESFKVVDREVYSLVKKNLVPLKPIFSKTILEKRLNLIGTTRDWNTILKMKNLL
jgi:uncharacterized protein (DUF1697 family)